MICPQCEMGNLTEVIEDIEFTFRGHTKTFFEVKLHKCSACDYKAIIDPVEENQIDNHLKRWRTEILLLNEDSNW